MLEIIDLTKEGQRFRLAKGGNGGFGNAHFKSATNQAPGSATRISASAGARAPFLTRLPASVT